MPPLKEELRDEDPTLLFHFYVDNAAFDGSAWRSVAQLRLLMNRGPDQGYFPKPEKSLFIVDNPDNKESENR